MSFELTNLDIAVSSDAWKPAVWAEKNGSLNARQESLFQDRRTEVRGKYAEAGFEKQVTANCAKIARSVHA